MSQGQGEEAVTVEFTANPTQRKFIESRAEADMFASRKGEGKSASLAWACFYHTRHNPGATWLFIRDTWENLKRTTLEEFLTWFPEGVFGRWSADNKCFTWDTEKTGMKGKVYFMGADDESSASKIASMPLAGFAIDEPSAAAGSSSGVDEFVFDTALAQLRQPGMNWYAAKLAQNNPDESHWTYRRFVDPGRAPDPDIELLEMQDSGFKAWQTREPENEANLPPGYYASLEKTWAHRPDLVKRFVTGEYGYQQVGKAVTPEWNDDIHLAQNLRPVPNVPLHLTWDGGLNPTCLITQVTPMGFWLILEAHVGEEVGAFQLIDSVVKPAIRSRYKGFKLVHTGDPNLRMREQSNSQQSASKLITNALGGKFIPGPVAPDLRIEPLRAMMTRTINGTGQLQVDKGRAKEVWFALRGGWHWHITRTGQQGDIVKDIHSHPGDACFPAGTLVATPSGDRPIERVAVGDFVLTPFGVRRVLRSGRTGVVRELSQLTTTQGHVLTSTPDHLTFCEAGFVRSDAIGYGGVLSTLTERSLWQSVKTLLSSRGVSIGFRGAITGGTIGARPARAIFTELFGKLRTALSRRAATSTTSTAIRSITASRIWSASMPASITAGIAGAHIHGRRATKTNATWPLFEGRRPGGIDQTRAVSGTESTGSRRGEGESRSGQARVVTVERRSERTGPKKRSSVVRSAPRLIAGVAEWIMNSATAISAAVRFGSIVMRKPARVVTSARLRCEPTAVYNLTVEDDFCYYANDLLVANCGYGAAELFPLGKAADRPKQPEQQRIMGGYFNRSPAGDSLGMAKKGTKLPPEAQNIGGDK